MQMRRGALGNRVGLTHDVQPDRSAPAASMQVARIVAEDLPYLCELVARAWRPEPGKPVRVLFASPEDFEALFCVRTDGYSREITMWGEPDADGCYTPSVRMVFG